MRTVAWLVKGQRDAEPYFGAIIAREDGSGEVFGWYARVEQMPPEQRRHWFLLFISARGWGYLACDNYMNPAIVEVYPDPAPEIVERIKGFRYR